MKKKILLPILTFGLLLVTPLSTYAEGWVKSGSDWTYLDRNNNKITNE